MLECKGWILYSFEVEVLLGICGFVVDICNDLAIYVFIKISKNASSFVTAFHSKFYFGVYVL